MNRALRWGLGAAAGAAYAWFMVRRNEALEPPPLRSLDGELLEERRLVFSDGARVSYVDAGQGPPLLMVPGADGVKETWRHQVPHFARSRRVIAVDLRSRIPDGADFDLYRRDLLEVMEALDTGPVELMGQSLGGAIALRFAARHPGRVRSLVLCNTLARVAYDHVGLDRSLLAPVAMATTRYLPTALARLAARGWSRAAVWIFDDSPGSENVIDYALRTGPRTASPRVSGRRIDLLKREDLRDELGAIRAPTLVVKGPRDAYCPPAWAREIAAGIEGAAYVEVPGTGHCSHVALPGAFNRVVGDWLDGVAARTGRDAGGTGSDTSAADAATSPAADADGPGAAEGVEP